MSVHPRTIATEPIYRENLRRHVYQSVNSYAEDLERDVSDYVISIKEALKLGLDIPKEFIIPSHFINAMRELYNNERRFDEVIKLAEYSKMRVIWTQEF